MRTFNFYTTIAYYLLRYGNTLNKNAKRLHSEGKTDEAYRFIDKIEAKAFKRIIKVAGAEVTVKGIENINPDETYLFVSNHQSNYDIPLLYTFSPIKMAFVAKQEMEKWPIVGELMKLRGCILLNRTNPRKAVDSIKQGVNVLRNGESMAVFPEGKRSKSNSMNSFKPGSFKFALHSDVKVAPVVIKNSHKLMEANNGKIKPAKIEITFLKPINPKKYKDAVTLSNYVEKLIKEEIE